MRRRSQTFWLWLALIAPALLTSLMLDTACVKAQPTLTPVGVAAFHGTQVVQALDLIRDIAINAESQTPKLLSTNTVRTVVTWHRTAVQTIGAVPTGWQASVLASLNGVDAGLTPSERAVLAPYLALARTLLLEVGR